MFKGSVISFGKSDTKDSKKVLLVGLNPNIAIAIKEEDRKKDQHLAAEVGALTPICLGQVGSYPHQWP